MSRATSAQAARGSYTRTKIIATIGPSCNSAGAIQSLIRAGANGLRLNFSHGTDTERDMQIQWIRDASYALGTPVAIIQDLQGPKVRLGDFDGTIEVHAGQQLAFQYHADYAGTGHVPVQFDIARKVRPGDRIYLVDGRVHGVIDDVAGDLVRATMKNDGVLRKRKGLNLPDTDFHGDILTPKDLADILFGAKRQMDYVALSFVQTADDIANLRSILSGLGSHARIIAKIETKAAADNIDAIARAADALMVARGDLAVETPAESVPVVQREIVGLGRKYAKPTIVATQMLLSMVDAPEPTRAEVSDVAGAVFMGTDCVMLSDETANGTYPLRAVEAMKRIILYSEQYPVLAVEHRHGHEEDTAGAIAASALVLADKIGAATIIAETRSGATALRIAALRPAMPILAAVHDARISQQLSIVYGTRSFVEPPRFGLSDEVIGQLRAQGAVVPGNTIVSLSGSAPGVTGNTDTIRIRTVA